MVVKGGEGEDPPSYSKLQIRNPFFLFCVSDYMCLWAAMVVRKRIVKFMVRKMLNG